MAVTCLSAAAVLAGNPRSADEVRSAMTPAIDAFVAERMQARGIPGAAIAIVQGGRTIHLAGYGQADASGRAVNPDTKFLLGSASKPFTAVALAQLVAEGRLSLDEPVGAHLEAVVGHPLPAFDRVTARHLLEHTSGLPNALGLPGSLPVRPDPDALRHRVADLVGAYRPSRSPGEEYEYSNANYILLAAVIEQVSGVPFAEYVQRRVFEPLGMAASFATDDDGRSDGLAVGHESWFGRWRPSAQPYDPAGAAMGYMGSTARDLATLLLAQMQEEEVEELPVRVGQVAAMPARPTGWDVPLESSVAGGWFVDEFAGHRTVSHAGSLPDFTAHLILVPGADGLGIAVLTNASSFVAAGHTGQYELSLGLLSLLLGEPPTAVEPDVVMNVVVPAAVWLPGLVMLALGGRDVAIAGRRLSARTRTSAGRRALRRLLPGLVHLGVGAIALVVVPSLFGVPLGSILAFYPDVGWGLTVTGVVGVVSGLTRIAFGLGAARQGRANSRSERESRVAYGA
jgi:CubicO group peptidase (beta-lactamase class C family)